MRQVRAGTGVAGYSARHRGTTILIGPNGGAAAPVLSEATREGERGSWPAPTHLARPLRQHRHACVGGPVHAHGAHHPCCRTGTTAPEEQKALGGVHPPRRSSGCAGPPGCRAGETRRLLRSLSRTTRPPRAARAGLPGDARTRVSAATNTVPPSQGSRIRTGGSRCTRPRPAAHAAAQRASPSQQAPARLTPGPAQAAGAAPTNAASRSEAVDLVLL